MDSRPANDACRELPRKRGHIKHCLCAITAAAILASGSAFAADLTRIAPPPPPPPPPAFTWTGFYIGGHAGFAAGQEHDNLSSFVDPTAIPPDEQTADSYDVSGIIGGVHAGFNLQSGNFVYGIEGDFDGADITGSHAFAGEYVSPPGGNGYDDYLNGTLNLKLDWQASIRARFGIAMDRWLVYATGGVAFGDTKLTASGIYTSYEDLDNTGRFSMSAHDVLTGWTVGLGTEYAFTDHWIGRAEVRYTELGSGKFNLNYFGDTIPLKARVDETMGLIGISYKF